MTSFVDSHCHLANAQFEPDCDAVVERARLSGAEHLVCIGESIQAARRARDIAVHHAGFISHTAGVHPHEAHAFDEARDGAAIRLEIAEYGAVAVGECGLDYHYDHSPREIQRAAFAAQLAIAGELARPVIVHTRLAEADTQAMVLEAGRAGVRGVLHCYTGSHALAEAALDVGWYISFSGIVTFKKWSDDALIRLVPADRILVESDAPYLAPAPHRSKRNEPAWVSLTVARVAAARGVAPAAIGAAAAENARRLFGLAPRRDG